MTERTTSLALCGWLAGGWRRLSISLFDSLNARLSERLLRLSISALSVSLHLSACCLSLSRHTSVVYHPLFMSPLFLHTTCSHVFLSAPYSLTTAQVHLAYITVPLLISVCWWFHSPYQAEQQIHNKKNLAAAIFYIFIFNSTVSLYEQNDTKLTPSLWPWGISSGSSLQWRFTVPYCHLVEYVKTAACSNRARN